MKALGLSAHGLRWLRWMRQGAATLSPLARPGGRPAPAPPSARGAWLSGAVAGLVGVRRFRIYRPPGIGLGERLPLMVMLHGCGQNAEGFAALTRMNHLAQRERFLVLYPEQHRLANAQGCWNWFDTGNGRAQAEAALILQSVDQVCLLQPVDRARVAIAGLSSGASMAALVGTRYPERFRAMVMHSGVPPGAAQSRLGALRAMQGRAAPAAAPAPAPGVQAAQPPAWPPLLAIHGEADGVVALHNSRAAAECWSQLAGARAGSARTVRRGQRYPMSITDFKRDQATVATLVAVDGLAHAWSGGAAGRAFSDARGPDATRMAWAFAARQFGA